MVRRWTALLWCAAALVPAARREAAAQVAAGSEFRVNVVTTDTQRRARAFTAADGSFVVTWNSFAQDGSDYGVMARRFDARGQGVGGEFQVNTFTTGYQYHPDVAGDRRGNFVIVWESGQDGSYASLHGQRFDAAGQRRGAEFRVNTYSTYYQYWGKVAVAPNGSFVVVWRSYTDGSQTSIAGRRYDAQGAAVGDEFVVNGTTAGIQSFPDVGVADDGSFVVAWMGAEGGADFNIFARRFGPGGAPVGAEFRVNSTATGYQNYPSLSVAPGGAFVVAWQSAGQDGSAYAVMGRRFDAAGAPLSGEFLVNAYTTGDQNQRAAVAADRQGNFTVAWRSAGQDGSASAVRARRFTAGGAPRGGEFAVNTYTTGDQDMAEVAVDAAGNFVTVWRSADQDGSNSGVFARRWGGLVPAALTADASGNAVWEPGETVEVRPGWRNVNGAAQAFGGALSNLAGPAGATYTITDAAGSYGTVPDNTVGPCTDCYGVMVSDPSPRPAVHWDATVLESLTPDTHGQQKTWTLHVGRSFTDVPAANPFYRFIETLLHHGVTGGCTATTYCPSTVTTRDQMSVFVLVAKEGAGFAPPLCVPPNTFGDVPETSPFCRFIEELAARGVVGGCAPNLYCPNDAVTREQMSVFVLRTLDPALSPPACGTPVFNDVPASSPFCRWIEELVRRGVVAGCAPGLYCPGQPVTREQMGVFISVTFGLALYGT
jgi:hypothetical protein